MGTSIENAAVSIGITRTVVRPAGKRYGGLETGEPSSVAGLSTKPCAWCGNEFIGQRDKITCSRRCRDKAWMSRKAETHSPCQK